MTQIVTLERSAARVYDDPILSQQPESTYGAFGYELSMMGLCTGSSRDLAACNNLVPTVAQILVNVLHSDISVPNFHNTRYVAG
jgi:hypothetical protein